MSTRKRGSVESAFLSIVFLRDALIQTITNFDRFKQVEKRNDFYEKEGVNPPLFISYTSKNLKEV